LDAGKGAVFFLTIGFFLTVGLSAAFFKTATKPSQWKIKALPLLSAI